MKDIGKKKLEKIEKNFFVKKNFLKTKILVNFSQDMSSLDQVVKLDDEVIKTYELQRT